MLQNRVTKETFVGVSNETVSSFVEKNLCFFFFFFDTLYNSGRRLGPVVQRIISLTSSLRGQLLKCFMTLFQNTMIFIVEKIGEAFALQKLLTFFQQKILAYIRD